MLLSDPRALKVGSIGVSSFWKEKKIDHHGLFLFLFGFLLSETFSCVGSAHARADEWMLARCLFLAKRAKTDWRCPAIPRLSTRPRPAVAKDCHVPPKAHQPRISLPGFQDTRGWERTSPCPGSGRRRVRDRRTPPTLDSSGAGSTNPRDLAGVSYFLPGY